MVLKLTSPIMGTKAILVCIILQCALLCGGCESKERSIEDIKNIAAREARVWCSLIRADITSTLNEARTVAQSMEEMKSDSVLNRNKFSDILENVLKQHPEFLAVWTCWEPNALDNLDDKYRNTAGHDETGRYIPFWNRVHGNISVQPLKFYTQEGLGDYYLLPLQSGKEILFNPIAYEVANEIHYKTTFAVPIHFGEKIVGVVGIDVSLKDYFKPITRRVRIFDVGYGFIISNNGVIAAHPTKWSNVGKSLEFFNFKPDVIQAVKEGRKGSQLKISKVTGKKTLYIFEPIQVGSSDMPWSLAINIPLDQLDREGNRVVFK